MINYHTGFYGWTQEQAAFFKVGQLPEWDIERQRINCSETLKENSSLNPPFDTILKKADAKPIIKASQETALDKHTFPSVCPWTFSQVLDDNFYPNAGE